MKVDIFTGEAAANHFQISLLASRNRAPSKTFGYAVHT